MTEQEMRKLKIGDVVSFHWDDGQNGWVDFRDGKHLVKKEEG